VFETDCTIVVTDSVGNIPIPNLTSGVARLQSRTFTGKPGAPAAGQDGYEYRVDLTTAVTNAEFSCVTDLAVDFGPVTKLQYNNVGPLDDVYVVTHGGLGKIGLLLSSRPQHHHLHLQPTGLRGVHPEHGGYHVLLRITSEFAPARDHREGGVPGDLPVDVKARAPDHPRRPVPPLVRP